MVTISRRRPDLLRRCMKSVENQDYTGTVKQLIVVDDCARTMAFLAEESQRNGNLSYVLARRPATESSGLPRLARLRNYAVTLVDTSWIGILDDDNEYEANHIASLVECAVTSSCPAVHSHRQLLSFEGDPFLEPRWPWCRDPKQAEERYCEMVEKGVIRRASNIVRDRVDVSPGGSGVVMVDTNLWLIKTEVLWRVKFAEQYSYQDWLDNVTEDDKLVETLVSAGIKIACSEQPSLKYYLGGYSNDFKREYSHSEPWLFNGHASR